MKRILPILLIVIISFSFITGCEKNKNKTSDNLKNIQITVYDNKDKIIFDKKLSSEKELLIDALKEIDELNLKTEDGPYGEYILSIKGLKQEDSYYWIYNVNGEYASVGVSNYKIKDKDVYTFKLEKFN